MANKSEVIIDMLSEIILDLVSLKAMVYTDSVAKVYIVDRQATLVREGLPHFMKKCQ